MPTIVIRHKVSDMEKWLNGHQDRVETFGSSTSGFKTFRDTDDPYSVVLVLEVTDMEKFETMVQDPRTAKLKEKHTVIDPLIISMPLDI